MKRRILICLACSLLSGCASTLDSVLERSTRKETVFSGKPYEINRIGGASLNSTRRMVISGPIPANHFVCSEPAPDTALDRALTTALTATAKGGTGKLDASLDLHDSAILTNIVLSSRTELVEIWRTTSYNYCLLLMNGQMTQAHEYLQASKDAIEKATNVMIAQKQATTEIASKAQTSSDAVVAPKAKTEMTVQK